MFTRMTALIVCLMASSLALAAEHTKDTLETVKKSTEAKDAVLVDVRELDEWKAGHVTGATFLPLSALEDASKEAIEKKLPKDKVIYTHCRAGRRSVAAAEILEKLGYDVRPLKPGFEDLIQAGFPKEVGEPK
jgi:rhodanese-related sulfurtransferase